MTKYKAIEKMLYNYEGNRCEIQDIDIELNSIRKDYTGINPITYGDGGRGSTVSSLVENEVIKKEEKIERLEKRKAILFRESSKIENALNLLTDIEKTIIENFYFKGLQWWQVCSIIGYSERWAKQTRREAINKMTERIHL